MIKVTHRPFLGLKIFVSLLVAVGLDGCQTLMLCLRVSATLEFVLQVDDSIALFVISSFVDFDLFQLGQRLIKSLLVGLIQI